MNALNKRVLRRLETFLLTSRWSKSSTRARLPCWACRRKSSSSNQWLRRQRGDHYAREAKVQGLRSRAAFKLLEIDHENRIFRPGQTVLDLGFAPGSWTQVAVARTSPGGRVLGVDIIPAKPPAGASSMQANFLSRGTQLEIMRYFSDPARGRTDLVASEEHSYIDMERHQDMDSSSSARKNELHTVDVILSDMLEPWPQVDGFWKNNTNNAYFRLTNTSGIAVRDHGASMDLCDAALLFAVDCLRPGGHFICKYYQGAEDKGLERRLKRVFERVKREKPEASRAESKEGYFVALRRHAEVSREAVVAD